MLLKFLGRKYPVTLSCMTVHLLELHNITSGYRPIAVHISRSSKYQFVVGLCDAMPNHVNYCTMDACVLWSRLVVYARPTFETS